MQDTAAIPMKAIGPIKIIGSDLDDEVEVPLATFETTLWPSTNRGAKATYLSGGINTVLVDDRMCRSIAFQAQSIQQALKLVQHIIKSKDELAKIVEDTSRFCRLLDVHTHVIADSIYLRFEFATGDAAGHNMVTLASQQIQTRILEVYPELQYISVSANYCVDKKASAVNSILGRGKYVVADLTIPRDICEKTLKTTPEKIVDLNIKKNLIGSIAAGSLHTANAHFANLLLATYLATGQDAANIVEGSQGITSAEVRNGDLYFAVTLPNIIVGTVGHGKELDFVQENLKMLGCTEDRPAGENAKRLALIVAATVLCGELSLMAALTNPGELMRAHQTYERKAKKAEVVK